MADALTLPPERRYSTVVNDAEGVRRNMGRLRFLTDGDQAMLTDPRTGEVRFVMTPVDASLYRRQWTITGDDGSTWQLSGCGCGRS